MIKSGDENIYPAEVERALKSHPAVADAAVIGVPDDALAPVRQGRRGARQATATADELIAHVAGQVASYKKPREVVFADAIPKQGLLPDYDALDAAHGGGGYPGAT